MALGGGVWVTQNKVLPGSYINFVSIAKATSALGERGVVAIPLNLNKAAGTVIEIEKLDFVANSQTILGVEYDADEVAPLREIFCHATKVFVYDLGDGNYVSAEQAVYQSAEQTAVTTPGTDTMTIGGYTYTTLETDTDLATQLASFANAWNTNNGTDWTAAVVGNAIQFTAVNVGALSTLGITAPTGTTVVNEGVDGVNPLGVQNALDALEPYEFNVLCAYTSVEQDILAYITAMKSWRDDYGKKCQLVVYNQEKPDHEGVINVVSTVSDDSVPAHALTAWVAGAQAGCAVNSSCTNMIYDGEFDVVCDKTQSQLEACIESGQFVFHLVYGDVRVLEDINSFTTVTTEKGEDFKSNQTIRVIDQIANDIAKLFNTKYLGKIPNNASGRVSLWADIVAHHRELEEIQAIENFDSSLLTVEQGDTKKSVVVTDYITATNALSQLYMTVIVS